MLKENYAVLSLTRSPLNPLMWAHYGQEHSGIVIDIDINGAGFTNEKNNFVPVHLGNVIYTQTKPVMFQKQSKIKTLWIKRIS
ncbi:MAG: DUF2971 domain-containing protein [Candidatus Scalindua sp.]|nr:DUF2971 domain-containing protein [Candidatus Scalindua sp.]